MLEGPSKYNLPVNDSARHSRELSTLYKVSSVLGSNQPQEHLLTEVLEILNVELSLRNGVIALLSEDGDELAVEVVQELSLKKHRGIRYRMGEGITGRVIQTGQGIIVPRVSEEPLFLNRFERRQLPAEEISFICVPIAFGQEVIGTISVDRLFEESAPLEEDMRV